MIPSPVRFLATCLVGALSVAAIKYNATLDPWNINKNQGKCIDRVVSPS